MKKLKPAQQGALDSLCGLYCVLNAMRHTAAATGADLPNDRKLFNGLVGELDKFHSLKSALSSGIPFQKLTKLARIAGAKSGLFSVVPLDKFSAKYGLDSILDVARRATSDGALIICHLDTHAHWTLVTGATRARLHLMDSSDFPSFIKAASLNKAGGSYDIGLEQGLVLSPTR